MKEYTEEWICTVRIIDGVVAKYHRRKELIRCKECKAYRNCKCVKNNMIAVRDSDFCSRAERKEE